MTQFVSLALVFLSVAVGCGESPQTGSSAATLTISDSTCTGSGHQWTTKVCDDPVCAGYCHGFFESSNFVEYVDLSAFPWPGGMGMTWADKAVVVLPASSHQGNWGTACCVNGVGYCGNGPSIGFQALDLPLGNNVVCGNNDKFLAIAFSGIDHP